MPHNGVGPAPRETHITDDDREAPEKGEAARAVTEGAAARPVVAQPARRRTTLNTDRQVVPGVRYWFGAGRIDATRRSDDAELL